MAHPISVKKPYNCDWLYDCPFCGAEEEEDGLEIQSYWEFDKDMQRIKHSDHYAVVCKNCGGQTDWFPTEEAARFAWNTRV